MILDALLLLLGVAADLVLQTRTFGVSLSPGLATLFLFYLGFRRRPSEIFLLLLLFLVVVHPFTGRGAFGVFPAYWAVLFLVCRLRAKVFAEAYVTHAAWVFVFSLVLRTLLAVFVHGAAEPRRFWPVAAEAVAGSAVPALLTVPCFLFWDAVRSGRSRRGNFADAA